MRTHPDGIWTTVTLAGMAAAVTDDRGAVIWCNPAFAELGGRTPEDCVDRSVADALGTGRTDRLAAAITALGRGGSDLRRIELESTDWAGRRHRLALSASVTHAWDERPRLVVMVEDLTADRRGRDDQGTSRLQSARRSTEDALTGLPNRDTFEQLLEVSLRRAHRIKTPLAVMSCDIDGFRRVNERLGDAAGDQVLQWIASRLTHTLRHQDLLARFGSDEFVVVAEEVRDEAQAHQVARRLAAAIAEPVTVDGIDIRMGISIGFTLAYGPERTADLLAEADRALHCAKRAGGGRSMSFAEANAASGIVAPTEIDWNELAVPLPQ